MWLEIGFGGGEHLVWQARANPDVGLIGCEVFEDGVVKVLSAIDEAGLGNVRLYTEDAREVLRRLPQARSTGSSSCSPTRGRRSATSSGA